ncbi:hypothetical protein AM609_04510 [Actinomyces sp. oral taxon 414]|uniref:hypothetical protein n=1 Tax=Actinomyces sp. oral taxon 414 TaxID=712122 RepID=UPI0006ADAEFA|nr:hypothetical protein [Actinomyces sp. oral taxon 414]ALC98933.1 hypothetical protein AM609_04510 [Actinomyces sp. oral taxon 414]
MAQSPAPYTNPELPDKFIVRSQASSNRLIVVLVVLVCLILMLMALFFLLLEPDPYDYLGEQSFRPFSLITIFSVLLFAPIIAYFVWLIRKEQRTRTIVDGNGLLLEQPGAGTRFIPWQDAHGRISIKTVSQYVPGASTPAMMALVLVAFDQEQIILPGSVLNSQPHSSRNIGEQTYATAMNILAYDPWGQSEPLTQSDNTFTPYMPQSMYMSQNIMRT